MSRTLLTIIGAAVGIAAGELLILLHVWEDQITVLFTLVSGAVLIPVTVKEMHLMMQQAEIAAAEAVEAERIITAADFGAVRLEKPYSEEVLAWAQRNLTGPQLDILPSGTIVKELWMVPEENAGHVKQTFFSNSSTRHFSERLGDNAFFAVVD